MSTPLRDLGLTHEQLAALCREWMLAGHLIDRSGMPAILASASLETMRDVAIEEWMAASPVYTKRMQRLLGFEGDDVETIFKGMQFDIGAPPEFMDFRYRVQDRDHGEFWLAHCGALMDVEPMGEDYVVTMCHDIEDPTFDATAIATNRHAQVRPVHRPPRQPSDRQPHCHWTVTIVPEAEPELDLSVMGRLMGSRAETLPLPVIEEAVATDGWADYSGPFVPDLRLEQFASEALLAVLDEIALQGQLLARSFLLAAADRMDPTTTTTIGHKQMTGILGLTAKRLTGHLAVATDSTGLACGSPADVVRVVQVHPAFRPASYVDIDARVDGDRVVIELGESPAMRETDDWTWPALLAEGGDEAICAVARAVNPRARIERHGQGAWTVWMDPDAEPAPEADEVLVASFSSGADFVFSQG